MFKFIHAADIHLDSPLQGLERYDTAPVEKIRSATREALRNLVRLAIEEKVAFVLIAGDVYDGDWKDYNTGLYFRKELAPLAGAGIGVYLISGNHDAQSVVSKQLSLPEHVKVLAVSEAQTVVLDDLNVAIHGQGFAKRETTENLCKGYPKALGGMFNIGMLHTCAGGYEGHERYAPCTIADMLGHGYQYWALGHIHKRGELSRFSKGDPHILFPGNIQGRHIREAGAKGCTVVSVKDGEIVSAEHRDLDVFRWQNVAVALGGAGTMDRAMELARERLARTAIEMEGKAVAVRVELMGTPRLQAQYLGDPEQWVNEMRNIAGEVGASGMWVEKVKFKATAAEEADEAIDPDGPAGELLAMLEGIKTDAELRADLSGELEDLRKKLPRDLRDQVEGLNLESEGELSALLEDVKQLLLPRMGNIEGGDEGEDASDAGLSAAADSAGAAADSAVDSAGAAAEEQER